ncbi:NAD(P)-binding domain-containing protein [Streptomyces sp. 21So2-11]|uniref:NAD(P)-dependent oxidoreductase n=1 Tax=Streptomyces sp. 21So2-11 TaxID=3144408 RepID=UPI00321C166F
MDNDFTSQAAPVTVIGLGLMGRALAGEFLRAGHPTTVWNRTPAKADPLVAEGARLAPTVADALRAGPLTIICVTDYRAMYELIDPIGAELRGRTLVNLTSGTSTQAREAGEWAQQRGAGYLDGAIMAIPSAIGTDEAVLLHSGPQSDFESHRTTLESLGTVTYVGADHGLASLYDVAGLGIMWSVLNAWLHGAALLGVAGVDAATYTPFAQQMVTGVAQWLPGYAEQLDSGSYPADDATLDTHTASMSHLIEESEAQGVNAELPKLIKALADRSIRAGHGGEGYAALIKEFGKANGADQG